MKTYGALNLTESSPPQSFREPVKLDLAKEFLRVTATDQDRTINELIVAARAQAEVIQNRDLVTKQWDYTLDLFISFEAAEAALSGACSQLVFGNDNSIPLRRPLRSVDLVQYQTSDGQTAVLTEGTDYVVDLARGLIAPAYGKSWPFFTAAVSGAVLIRFTSGYSIGSVFWAGPGAPILVGMKMLITGWFEDRIPYTSGVGQIQELPYGIQMLIGTGAKAKVF